MVRARVSGGIQTDRHQTKVPLVHSPSRRDPGAHEWPIPLGVSVRITRVSISRREATHRVSLDGFVELSELGWV